MPIINLRNSNTEMLKQVQHDGLRTESPAIRHSGPFRHSGPAYRQAGSIWNPGPCVIPTGVEGSLLCVILNLFQDLQPCHS